MHELPLRDNDLAWYKKVKDVVHDMAYQKGCVVLTFAEELRRLCKVHRYNLAAMWFQAWHETAGFTSTLWVRNRNPAGIKNASSTGYQRYYNGVDAARAFVVHMSAYIRSPHQEDLRQYYSLDSRYNKAVVANIGLVYNTISDLAGRWAEDAEYGPKIMRLYESKVGVFD